MSEADLSERAIVDARALLAELVATGWTDIHVATQGIEIFIATAAGRQNPMAGPDHVDLHQDLQVILAPHVATLVEVAAAGTAVEKGQRIARIEVLDIGTALYAPADGVIRTVHASSQDLIEFGSAILTIAVAK